MSETLGFILLWIASSCKVESSIFIVFCIRVIFSLNYDSEVFIGTLGLSQYLLENSNYFVNGQLIPWYSWSMANSHDSFNVVVDQTHVITTITGYERNMENSNDVFEEVAFYPTNRRSNQKKDDLERTIG